MQLRFLLWMLPNTPWIQAMKCGGIICIWKKYILDNFDKQNQGKKIFWIPTLSFWRPCWHAPLNPAWWAGRPALVRWKLERTMYHFKNYFSHDLFYIHRATYIFPETCFAYTIYELEFTLWKRVDLILTGRSHFSEIFIRKLKIICLIFEKHLHI